MAEEINIRHDFRDFVVSKIIDVWNTRRCWKAPSPKRATRNFKSETKVYTLIRIRLTALSHYFYFHFVKINKQQHTEGCW